ncbi:MAG: response regulator [Rhodoferax sp.]|nr:response regulator [Rhodoferax sp.]
MSWMRQQREQGLGRAGPMAGDNMRQSASPAESVNRRRKLMVVDDNALHQQLFRAALGVSFALSEAYNSDLALQRIRLDPPDGVLLDVILPGRRNGYELCQLIKEDSQFQQVHVVIVTARTQLQDREKAFCSGADAYFPKPFSPAALLAYLIEKIPL